MILDICLPLRAGAELQRDGGIRLLNEINGSDRYTYPRFVIALSEHEELAKEFSLEAGIIHTSIYYNIASNEWCIRLGPVYGNHSCVLLEIVIPLKRKSFSPKSV